MEDSVTGFVVVVDLRPGSGTIFDLVELSNLA